MACFVAQVTGRCQPAALKLTLISHVPLRYRCGLRVEGHVDIDALGREEELAGFLEREQMNAIPLIFAIGGSDGFSDEARRSAGFTLSLGKMTLPHELARVVLIEQLYRAFTILKHHPYHLGH